jgi:hypothetical protein
MEYLRDVEEQRPVVDIENNVMVKEQMVLMRMTMMNQEQQVQYYIYHQLNE